MMQFIRKHALALGMLVLSALKIIMVGNLPLIAYPHATFDDALMVTNAGTILSQDWLGPYWELTLAKGPFFPIFLAVSKLVSLPYLVSVTLFYLLACALFVQGIRGIFKNRIYLFILFAVLAYNPISFSAQTFQRIYRSGVMPGLALIVFGCFFAVYLRREQALRRQLPWMIGGGLGLAALWLTREDGAWVLPFVAVCVAVTAGTLVYTFIKTRQRKFIIHAAMSVLPVAVFAAALLCVALINHSYYGIFTTNELSGSNFSKAIKSIYAVPPTEDIAYVSVPQSTLEKIYEVSPSMESIQPQLDHAMFDWEINGVTPGDSEVEDGWFLWCFREAVSMSGYSDDAAAANKFYLNVHQEIEQAFSNGLLERRPTMPSALMSPWRASYAKQWLPATLDAVRLIAGYGGTGAVLAYFDSAYNETLDLFAFMTGGNILYEGTAVSDTYAPWLDSLVSACNAVAAAYQNSGLPLFFAGLAAYAALTVWMLMRRKGKPNGAVDVWLITTATLLSVLVLAAGVAYTHISAFYAINSAYLAGAYPLLSAFAAVSLLYLAQTAIFMFRERRNAHGQPV